MISIIIMNKTAADIFDEYLAAKGLRQTNQRRQILDAFISVKSHCTIADLYDVLKKKDPSIGFATVHRNLRLLCEAGLAEEIKIGSGKARFELTFGQSHHDHLICLKCGKFIEVFDMQIERLQDKLAEANDFLPRKHKLEIYGYCRQCR